MSGDCHYRGSSILRGGGIEKREDEGQWTLSFVLPSLPPGINRLYEISHLSRNVRLSDQAALWKTQVIPFVKPCRWPVEWLLKLTLTYESNRWYHKNGKLRRVDLDGFLKLTIDAMFSKWGMDDSRLVEIQCTKTFGQRDQIKVTLEKAELR